MFSCYQTRRLNRIVVESTPLLETEAGKVIILWSVPLQQIRAIWQTDTIAERFDRRRRVIQHVVRVDHTDLMHGLLGLALFQIQVWSGCNTRSNKSLASKVVEVSAQFVVPSLGGVIVIEPCDLVQRWDRASVIRWHAEVRIADQEREMELLLDFTGHHCRVARFSGRVVRVWLVDTVGAVVRVWLVDTVGAVHRVPVGSAVSVAIGVSIGITVGMTVDATGRAVRRAIGAIDTVGRGVAVGMSGTITSTVHAIGLVLNPVGADAALDASQRGGNTGGFALRWEQVVVNVFDKDSLSLQHGKYSPR
jgi:hypothetical protein